MREISAQAAARLLREEPAGNLLLDVREPVELDQAAVSGAQHIPMSELPSRLAEIDRNKTVICMCHLGGRSAQVAEYLAAQGFPNTINLAGGIEAWAQDVDPGVIRRP